MSLSGTVDKWTALIVLIILAYVCSWLALKLIWNMKLNLPHIKPVQTEAHHDFKFYWFEHCGNVSWNTLLCLFMQNEEDHLYVRNKPYSSISTLPQWRASVSKGICVNKICWHASAACAPLFKCIYELIYPVNCVLFFIVKIQTWKKK